jgi:hypothetical protein
MSRILDAKLKPGGAPSINTCAFQQLVDCGGTLQILEPGVYDLDGTVRIGSNTTLIFGEGVYIRRVVPELGGLYATFINRGAYTGCEDSDIQIQGLNLICNEVDIREVAVPGLQAHLAFYHVSNLVIRDFRCMDLPSRGFCIQVCRFEEVLLENLHIEGRKDAVHFGCGRNFTVRHGTFRTYDDPIALNAHDYSSSNPEYGWIENGLIEDCYDLDQESTTGFFCRILAGAWGDWVSGMKVQNSDLVVSAGRVYSVYMKPNGASYVSYTAPTHTKGVQELDGIRWRIVSDYPVYSAGCRNIHFKDIHLHKKRDRAFCLHFDNDHYSRSVYPTATMPVQENIILENISIENQVDQLLESITPCDSLKIIDSDLGDAFVNLKSLPYKIGEYPEMPIFLSGTTFNRDANNLIECEDGRSATVEMSD